MLVANYSKILQRIKYRPLTRSLLVKSRLSSPRAYHSAAEAALLGRLAADASTIVEIGVFEGASAAILAKYAPKNASLYLVDDFRRFLSNVSDDDGGSWAVAKTAVARSGRPDVHVVWLRTQSENVGSLLPSSINLAMIDGDHSREGVTRDWLTVSDLVVAGGRVVFHDAAAVEGQVNNHPSIDVVNELFGENGSEIDKWTLEGAVDSCVVVRRNHSS